MHNKIISTFSFILFCSLVPNAHSADESDFTDIEVHDSGFKISFVNVGQGNASVILDNTTGTRIFNDGGSSQHPVHPHTKAKGIAWNNLRASMEAFPDALATQPIVFICSHPDKDHLNLFSNFILEERGVLDKNNKVSFYLGGSFEKYLSSEDSLDFFNSILTLTNPTVFSLSHDLSTLEMQDLKGYLETCKADIGIATGYEGREEALTRMVRLRIKDKVRPFILRSKLKNFSTEGRVMVEILGANAGHSPTRNYESTGCFEEETTPIRGEIINHEENMSSCVMRIIFYDTFSIIITGDATGITTDRIIHNFSFIGSPYNSLLCHILLTCHHGAITEESNNYEWVFAIQPVYAFFSSGKYRGYNHPQFDAIYNYSNSPRIKKDMTEHVIVCGRNKEKDSHGAKTQARIINVGEYEFIKTYN